MSGIKSGYGTSTLPFWAVFDLYVIFICTSIPGLAISPIMGDLTKIFPGTTQFETQLLEIGPNIAAIPFVFLGGWIGTKFNNNKLTTWTCFFYGIFGILFFFVPNMICLLILSFLIGICAGILSPLSSAFIADMFGGEKRTAQYGYTSATLNLVLMACVIATGYLAKINWRLPFLIYLLPIVPLFFAKGFKKYITNPSQIRAEDAQKMGTQKVHYKFSHEVNMGMLVRYCIFYFVITFVICAISMYIPFLFTDSGTAGDLTSILFFGIMASGYTLNWCLKILKKRVAIVVMIATALGFFLIWMGNHNVILVGLGILIATYFYGIAQPYYYERLSQNSSRIALTLTLAWFAVMDSIGNVVAAPIIDLIAKVAHTSTTTHPLVAFKICTILAVAGLIVVIIRQLIVAAKDHEEHKGMENGQQIKSIHPMLATATAGASTISTAVKSATESVKSATETVKTAAEDTVSAATSTVSDAAKSVASTVSSAAKESIQTVENAADKVAQTAAQTAEAAAQTAQQAAQTAEQAAKTAADAAESALKNQ